MYLRRALLSSQWFGDDGDAAARAGSASDWGRPMDFRDSPAEAEFRARLPGVARRAQSRACPSSSTDDEYWARQAEWHTALYDAGFFGLSWPARFGGHDLPTVFDVILDDELAAAGAPPRPSLGYLVQGIIDARQRRDPGPVPARADQRARALVPGVQRARRGLRPRRAAHHRDARRRRVRDRRPQDLDQLLRRRRLVPPPRAHRPRRRRSTRACPRSRCRCTSPGIEQRPLRMINGITNEFGQVLLRRRARPRRRT